MQKTMVVTGGTGGIGWHTARGLASTGAKGIVTGRDAQRGAAAVDQLREACGHAEVHLVTGDLSTRAGVAATAEGVLAATDRIDVLVNNAGMMAQERTVNDDGFELDFAVNVVAPYELTHHLLPALKATDGARVLNVTGGKASGPFEPVDLQSEDSFVPLVNYTRSKRAAEAMSLVLARELQPDGVGVHVVYPGRASTAMTQAMTPSSLPWYLRPAWPVFRLLIPASDDGSSAAKAAKSSVYAATTDALDGEHGRYIDTNQQLAELHPTVHDPANQQRVMDELGRA